MERRSGHACIRLEYGAGRLPAGAEGGSAVLITCHAWYHEQIGGSFKIATELAEHLAGRGHRVFYVCGSRERAPVKATIERGVELWRYPLPPAGLPHPAALLYHVRATFRLTREILRRRPVGCINGHTPLQFLGASLAARRTGARLVYSVHSPFDDELDCRRNGRRKRAADRLAIMTARAIDRKNCRRASVVQCCSRFTAGVLRQKYGPPVTRKTRIAPGWVDIERFRPLNDKAAVRARLGAAWHTARPVFFTVRRLEARMGLQQLVEAAGMLRRQGFQFRLLIGGAGPLEANLREQIQQAGLQETAHLLGRIAEDELPLCFSAADCFVLPTRALECFGLIVLEAYASGTPVIGTPVGAIPELVALQGPEWLTAGTGAREIADRMAAFLRGELVGNRTKLRALAERWRADLVLQQFREILTPCPT